jgi:hypothetical protein
MSVLAKWKPVWKEFYCQGRVLRRRAVILKRHKASDCHLDQEQPGLTAVTHSPLTSSAPNQFPAANANKYILSSHKLVIKFEYGIPVTFPEATERLMTLGYQSRDLAK